MKDKIETSAQIVLANIEEEIKVRQSEVHQLMITRDSLIELYELTGLPAEPVQTPERSADKPKRAYKKRGGQPVAPVVPAAGSGRAASAETVKLMAAARTAPEPFTAVSLHLASGLDTKFVANRLFAWKGKGYVEKAGYGQFRRTPQFPNEAPAE